MKIANGVSAVVGGLQRPQVGHLPSIPSHVLFPMRGSIFHTYLIMHLSLGEKFSNINRWFKQFI